MMRSIAALVTFAILAFSGATAFSQQPHHSQIIIGHRGTMQLKQDIHYLLGLSTEEDQAQEDNLIDFIDLMIDGVDEQRPMSVEVYTGTSPMTYMISAAVKNFQFLLANVGANFIMKPAGAGLHELLPPDRGWYRN